MKLTNPSKPFEIEDGKRFYIPGAKLEGECPGCGAPYTHDFGEQYLSYPKVNTSHKVGCYCDKCDHEWSVRIRVNLSLELLS